MADVPNTDMAPNLPSLKRRDRDEPTAAQPQEQPYKRAAAVHNQVNNGYVQQRGGPPRDTTKTFEQAGVPEPGDDWIVSGDWLVHESQMAGPVSDEVTLERAIAQLGSRHGGHPRFLDAMNGPHGAVHDQALSAGTFEYNGALYAPATQLGFEATGHFPLPTQPAHYDAGSQLHTTTRPPYPARLPQSGSTSTPARSDVNPPAFHQGVKSGLLDGRQPRVSGNQPAPAPSVQGAPVYKTMQPNGAATGGFKPAPGAVQPGSQNTSPGSHAGLSVVSTSRSPHADTYGYEAGRQAPSGQAHQKSLHRAPTNGHGGQPRSSQPREAQPQQAPIQPQNQTPSTHRCVIVRGSKIYSLPFWLTESLHAALSKTTNELPNPFDTTRLSSEDLLQAHDYVVGIASLLPEDLRRNIVPGIPLEHLRDFTQEPAAAMHPFEVLECRSLEDLSERLWHHLDFVALALIMQQMGSHSIVYWGAWSLLKHKTQQLIQVEGSYYREVFPLKSMAGTEEYVRRWHDWKRRAIEQSVDLRYNSLTKVWENILVGAAAGVKRSARPEDEADAINAQKRVRNHGHFTPRRNQATLFDQRPTLQQTAPKALTQPWSHLQSPSENLVFANPQQLKQPGGYPLPPVADFSFVEGMKKKLRQSIDHGNEAPAVDFAPSMNMNHGPGFGRGPHMSSPTYGSMKPPSNQGQALGAPNVSHGSRPSSPQQIQRNYVKFTGSTDVDGVEQPGPVPAPAKAHKPAPSATEVKAKPNTKLRSGPIYKPQDDPWFKQNGIETWKIQYPGDHPKLRRETPPFTSYEHYALNSKGLYRCLCENGPGCRSCDTGLSGAGLKKRVDKKLETWRRHIEKLIKEGKLDQKHKTCDKWISKEPMTEKEKEQNRLHRAEKRLAEANLTVNQPLVSGGLSAGATVQPLAVPEMPHQPYSHAAHVHEMPQNQPAASGGLYALTTGSRAQDIPSFNATVPSIAPGHSNRGAAGFQNQQVPSAQPTVQPTATSEQPPKPQFSAAQLAENTATARQVYVRKVNQPDLEYFDAYWAAKNAQRLGQTLTPDQQFWYRQENPSRMPPAALDKFWAKYFPESDKGMEILQRMATQEARRKAQQQAEERAKQEAAKAAAAAREAEERERVSKAALEVATEMNDEDLDSLFGDDDE